MFAARKIEARRRLVRKATKLAFGRTRRFLVPRTLIRRQCALEGVGPPHFELKKRGHASGCLRDGGRFVRCTNEALVSGDLRSPSRKKTFPSGRGLARTSVKPVSGSALFGQSRT